MPPSPTIIATLDEEKYTAACERLGVTDHPTVALKRGRIHRKEVYGLYRPATNHIELTVSMHEYDFERLQAVMSEMAITILHELRHAWQHEQHGDGWYIGHVVEAELDAEEWARRNANDFRGIIRVKRKFHRTGLSNLDRTAARVRRIV